MESGTATEIGLSLFRHAREGMLVYDLHSWMILHANPRAAILTGLTERELLSRRVLDLFNPVDSTRFESIVVSDREEYTVSANQIGPPGQQRALPLSLSFRHLETGSGEVGLIVLHPLEFSSDVLASFFQVSPDPFCILDAEGTCLHLNPAWEQMLGYPVSELTGRNCLWLMHPDDQPDCDLTFDHLHQEIEVRKFECRMIHKNASEIWVLWNAIIMNGLGYAVARDITHEKRKHLTLQAAHDAVKKASITKNQYFVGVSHEIRTPMTAILSLAEVLLHDPYLNDAPAQCQENLKAIKLNGEHLIEIINDILDLSKIEIGKLEVGLATYSPVKLVEETIALMRIRAEAKGLPLILERSKSCPAFIVTDPTRLRQVLINLVSNAIKYTDRGEIRIKLGLVESEIGEPSQLRFDVIDTGVGLSAEELKHLFQPYFRAKRWQHGHRSSNGPHTSPPTGSNGGSTGDPNDQSANESSLTVGTGLGLVISKRLAEMLGGTISVSSTPGIGSTFSVVVSASATAPSTMMPSNPAPLSQSLSETSALPRDVMNARVLLAEDSPTNRKAIAFCLEYAGAKVVMASNGAEAVDLTMEAESGPEPFDLVLMDMQMPVLDGYEATQRLRQSGFHRPIIALTAYTQTDSVSECLEIGCDAFAGKPIDWQRLVRLIMSLTRRVTSESPKS